MSDRQAGGWLLVLAVVLLLLALYPAAEGVERLRNLLLAGVLGSAAAGVVLLLRGRADG